MPNTAIIIRYTGMTKKKHSDHWVSLLIICIVTREILLFGNSLKRRSLAFWGSFARYILLTSAFSRLFPDEKGDRGRIKKHTMCTAYSGWFIQRKILVILKNIKCFLKYFFTRLIVVKNSLFFFLNRLGKKKCYFQIFLFLTIIVLCFLHFSMTTYRFYFIFESRIFFWLYQSLHKNQI